MPVCRSSACTCDHEACDSGWIGEEPVSKCPACFPSASEKAAEQVRRRFDSEYVDYKMRAAGDRDEDAA